MRYRQPKALAPIPKSSSVLTNLLTGLLSEESFERFRLVLYWILQSQAVIVIERKRKRLIILVVGMSFS